MKVIHTAQLDFRANKLGQRNCYVKAQKRAIVFFFETWQLAELVYVIF